METRRATLRDGAREGMRPMKRLGVQLAAAGITILLGVLAAAHAHKDRETDSERLSQTDPPTGGPKAPTPIADLTGDDWDDGQRTRPGTVATNGLGFPDQPDFAEHPAFGDRDDATDRSEPGLATGGEASVRLVQHVEGGGQETAATSMPATAFEPPSGFTPPSDSGSTADSGPAAGFGPPSAFQPPPSFGQPADPNAADGSDLAGFADDEFPQAPGDRQQRFGGDEFPGTEFGGTEFGDDVSQGPATAMTPPSMPTISLPASESPNVSEPPAATDSPAAAMPAAEMAFPGFGDPADPPPAYPSAPVNALRETPGSSDAPPAEPSRSSATAAPTFRFGPPETEQDQDDLHADESPVTHFGAAPAATPTPAGPPPSQRDAFSTGDVSATTATTAGGDPRETFPPTDRLASAGAFPRGADPSADLTPSSAAPLSMGIDRRTSDTDEVRTHGAPGDRRLEGAQTPSVVIQKRAPAEVKVGKPASFVIHLRNVGSAEAIDVRVEDRVPAGMQLVDATPSPLQQGDRLLWQLGAIPAGDERTITMQLVPEREGELGSVARVSFEAAASVRTVSTRPELKIVQRAPEAVLIGQQLEIELEVSNPGSGEAIGVVLQVDVPEGLEHPKGRQLDNLLGSLRPGEVRREVLRLRAVAPGRIENVVRLVSDDGLTHEHTIDVDVIAPQIQVRLNGPSRRYLERQATYQLEIANVGSAEATNVEIAAYLDRGLTFVSTGNQGQYDPARHAVFWSLARLPSDAGDSVPLTLLPVEEGEQAIRLEAAADLGVREQHEQSVTVDSLAELTFQLADSADPIELGAETTYEIRLANSGSRDDGNVRVQLQLPPGLELLSSDVDAEHDGRGGVFFEPKQRFATGAEAIYRVQVRGVQPGRHVAKVTVVSDQSDVPVTKEESTMVYADR